VLTQRSLTPHSKRAAPVGKAAGLTWPSDNAHEYEYTPGNALSGLCAGVAVTAANGTPVALQPCGLTSKTVWITVTGAPYVLTSGSVEGVLKTQQLFLLAGTFPRTQMCRTSPACCNDPMVWPTPPTQGH
jgi:hypothetical protein